MGYLPLSVMMQMSIAAMVMYNVYAYVTVLAQAAVIIVGNEIYGSAQAALQPWVVWCVQLYSVHTEPIYRIGNTAHRITCKVYMDNYCRWGLPRFGPKPNWRSLYLVELFLQDELVNYNYLEFATALAIRMTALVVGWIIMYWTLRRIVRLHARLMFEKDTIRLLNLIVEPVSRPASAVGHYLRPADPSKDADVRPETMAVVQPQSESAEPTPTISQVEPPAPSVSDEEKPTQEESVQEVEDVVKSNLVSILKAELGTPAHTESVVHSLKRRILGMKNIWHGYTEADVRRWMPQIITAILTPDEAEIHAGEALLDKGAIATLLQACGLGVNSRRRRLRRPEA